jgi:hypothetical protein
VAGTIFPNEASDVCGSLRGELRLYRPCPSIAAGVTASVTIPSLRQFYLAGLSRGGGFKFRHSVNSRALPNSPAVRF